MAFATGAVGSAEREEAVAVHPGVVSRAKRVKNCTWLCAAPAGTE
jgi:hypothetical protein